MLTCKLSFKVDLLLIEGMSVSMGSCDGIHMVQIQQRMNLLLPSLSHPAPVNAHNEASRVPRLGMGVPMDPRMRRRDHHHHAHWTQVARTQHEVVRTQLPSSCHQGRMGMRMNTNGHDDAHEWR
jgi:hypothetical protein